MVVFYNLKVECYRIEQKLYYVYVLSIYTVQLMFEWKFKIVILAYDHDEKNIKSEITMIFKENFKEK